MFTKFKYILFLNDNRDNNAVSPPSVSYHIRLTLIEFYLIKIFNFFWNNFLQNIYQEDYFDK